MLKDMIAAFGEYYYITIIFVIFLIAAVFVWIKAVGASRKKGRERDAILAKLKEEKELCDVFSCLTAEKASAAQAERLIHGVALNIQRCLEKSGDMNAAFTTMPEAKRFVYALDFVFYEDAESLSGFFRKNGKPLTTEADDAARKIIGGDFFKLFHQGYDMFDDDNEEVSVVPDAVNALDEAYEKALESERDEWLSAVKKYIYENVEIINQKEMD